MEDRTLLNAGALDTTFGTAGKVTTDFGSGNDLGTAVAIQPDGKIVLAGFASNGTNDDFAVARYCSNGSLDNGTNCGTQGFGAAGTVTTAFGSGLDQANGIAIQPDGRIVVVGLSFNGTDNDFAVARYNPDGTLDLKFGTGGKVTTNFAGANDQAKAVAIQPNGRIVVVGLSGADFAVARYNADGSLDADFAADGLVTTNISATDQANAVAIQPDGKIIAAGFSSSNNFALVRYNPDGSLDTTFNATGKVTTDFGGTDQANSAAIQADGKIVAAGFSSAGSVGGDNNFALARYNADGTLDTSFSFDGKVITDFSASVDNALGLAIQANGKIVAAGVSDAGGTNDFALARYNPDGSLDNPNGTTLLGFGTNGKVTTAFGTGADQANAVAIQPNGKIVAAGVAAGTNNDFAVARYLSEAPDIIVTGIDAGVPPRVTVIDARTGSEITSFLAYAATFLGGVHVATGDVNGDGVPDVITGPGPATGSSATVKVFDGFTGTQFGGPIGSFLAYGTAATPFSGGVFVAAGDVNGDGKADIITGAGPGTAQEVKVFSGADGSVLFHFFAFATTSKGGVSVAVGDVNGDGFADIIVGNGPGGPPRVKVFSGATGKRFPRPLGSFLAYESNFRGGVFVAAGDVNGDGKADVITGPGTASGTAPGASREPLVKVFSGLDRSLIASFFAYSQTFRGGVRVAAGDVNGDGRDDIIVGSGPGQGPLVRIFDGMTQAEIDSFFADELDITHGVFVAASARRLR